MSHPNIQNQRGGTLLGFVLGLVIGLTIALGVAMYVTKVPMPFSNKNQSRSADQDAVEAQKNKDWNPNGALQTKPVAPEAPADPAAAVPGGTTAGAPNPAAGAPAPAVTADPLADLVKKQNPNSAPAAPGPSASAPAPAASTPAPGLGAPAVVAPGVAAAPSAGASGATGLVCKAPLGFQSLFFCASTAS